MLKFVAATAVDDGVNVKVQLPDAGMLVQLLSLTVTFPFKAVPVNMAVTLVAASSDEVLLTVSAPDTPLVIKVNGDPDTLIIAVVIALAKLIFN